MLVTPFWSGKHSGSSIFQKSANGGPRGKSTAARWFGCSTSASWCFWRSSSWSDFTSRTCCFLEASWQDTCGAITGHVRGCFLQGRLLIEGESWLIHGARRLTRASSVRDYRLFFHCRRVALQEVFRSEKTISLSTSNQKGHELYPSPGPLHHTVLDKWMKHW